MYSEMIVELQGSSGTFFFSGDAVHIWTSGLSSGTLSGEAVLLREPASWERELWPRNWRRPHVETGPPMLGEESTLFVWSEDHRGTVFVETEEGSWIDRLSRWPAAWTVSVCWRPDSRTVRFAFPSSLLAFREDMLLQGVYS